MSLLTVMTTALVLLLALGSVHGHAPPLLLGFLTMIFLGFGIYWGALLDDAPLLSGCMLAIVVPALLLLAAATFQQLPG